VRHGSTVECPQAFNLRQAMREHWALPDEEWFRFTGPDWLLLLLARCSCDQQDLIKLVFWRAWTIHNKITHQSCSSRLSDSVFFILNFREQCIQARLQDGSISRKGKEVCSSFGNRGATGIVSWEAPLEGWTKVNFDYLLLRHQDNTKGR
jgi:hypothetical protein